MSEEIFESQKLAFQNDKHTFQFIALVECCDGNDVEWIQKYNQETGFENITQKALFNKYKGKVLEFYLFPKNKPITITDKVIDIPHPSIGANLRNGDIILNGLPITFKQDFDDELKDLDLIYYWTNLLSSHKTYAKDGVLVSQRDYIEPKMYHVGWKNGAGLRIIKLDLDTGKFSIRTTKR